MWGPLLATQKPVNRPGWWERKFALFQMPATREGEGGGHLSKGQLPNPDRQGVRVFTDRVGVGQLHAETTQSCPTVIFKLVISGLTSIIFVVLGTVNLQFQGYLFPFLCDQFLQLWPLMSWVQSGHHVVNFSTCCFDTYKTTHKIWLRILSILRKN